MNTREYYMYNLRGVMEIPRYSTQPNANALIDCIYHSQAPLPIHAAGHPRSHGLSAPIAFRSWLAIL